MTAIDGRLLPKLSGHPVRGTHGAKIGRVVDVYSSADAPGKFVTVSTGMFSGSAFVPLEQATMDGGSLGVPYGQDLVKDAPRVGTDGELSAAEEDRLYRHYGLTPPAGEIAPGPEFVEPAVSGTDDAMTRSEQQLTVGTRRQESGRARLHKYVGTETVSAKVAVMHDEIRIEREAMTETTLCGRCRARTSPRRSTRWCLTEEVAVSGTTTTPVERIRMVKTEVTEQVTVSEDLGREVIEVERTK